MRTRALRGAVFLVFMALFNTGFSKAEKATLNFDDVDIGVFLKAMSGITGKSFVLTDKVRGRISFVSSKDIPAEKVYDVVLAILRAQGLAAVQGENNVVQIFPAQEALKMSGRIFYGTDPVDERPDSIVTQIIPLSYANAAEVLNVVRPLFPTEILLSAYPSTNTVIINGSPPMVNLVLSVIRFIDTQVPAKQSDIHVYRLDNSDAETMAKTLSSLASSIPVQQEKLPQPPRPAVAEGGLFADRFRVVASKETNSIIIICAPQDYEKIVEIIRELDVKREQVLVEALIVEITLNDDRSVGFDWRALARTGIDVDAVAQSNTGLMKESIQTGGLAGLTIGLLNGTIPTVYAILNANRENTNFKIVSTPEVVTIDNNEAVINISEQIPFLTSSRVDENGNVIQTFDYKDVGITLKLTPHVNKNGYITMDIKQTIKKIVEGTETLQNPSVFNREVTSRVTVKSDRTIVLGGLIRDDMTVVEKKVPLLGDIPLLGLLFRRKVKKAERTNLMIFITPHILTEDQAISDATEQRRVEQRNFESETAVGKPQDAKRGGKK